MIIYSVVIAVIGIIATAYASFRPDVENAGRLYAESDVTVSAA